MHTEFGFSPRSSRDHPDFFRFASDQLYEHILSCLPKRRYQKHAHTVSFSLQKLMVWANDNQSDVEGILSSVLPGGVCGPSLLAQSQVKAVSGRLVRKQKLEFARFLNKQVRTRMKLKGLSTETYSAAALHEYISCLSNCMNHIYIRKSSPWFDFAADIPRDA